MCLKQFAGFLSIEVEAATGRRAPIVALTANAFEQDRRQCFELGMDGFLTKPVSPVDLRAEMERVTSAHAETVNVRDALPAGKPDPDCMFAIVLRVAIMAK